MIEQSMKRFLKWWIWFQFSKARRIHSQEEGIVARVANFNWNIPRFGFSWWYWFPWVKFNMGISIYWLCFVMALNAIPVAWGNERKVK